MWWVYFVIKFLLLLGAVTASIIDFLMWTVVFFGRGAASKEAFCWAKGVGLAAVVLWLAFIIGAFL